MHTAGKIREFVVLSRKLGTLSGRTCSCRKIITCDGTIQFSATRQQSVASQSYRQSSHYENSARSGRRAGQAEIVSEHGEEDAPSRSPSVRTVRARGFDSSTPSWARKTKNRRVESDSKIDDREDNPKTAFDLLKKLRSDSEKLNASDADEMEELDPLEDPYETKERKTQDASKQKTSYPAGSPASLIQKPSPLDRFDSKGFKIYDHLVPEYHKMTPEEIVTMLRKRIIYDAHNIVAIDKPYGLPVHGGPGVHHSLAKYLPQLTALVSKDSGVEKLHLVNRIDKETTGVVLLARDSNTAMKLHDLFLNHIVKKVYWAVTIARPDPVEGVIDIPIGDTDAFGSHRRILRPVRVDSAQLVVRRNSDTGTRAVTNYRTLAATGSSALVELSPKTGGKHQVRIHLAYGLNCPILGDHKYSHFTKLAPQKLPKDILLRMKMRQAKVRTVPMMLHSKTLILPEFEGSENVVISAELPAHFKRIMAALKMRPGKFEY